MGNREKGKEMGMRKREWKEMGEEQGSGNGSGSWVGIGMGTKRQNCKENERDGNWNR